MPDPEDSSVDPAPIVGEARPARGRYLLAASWAYAVVMLAVIGLIHGVGDSWWWVPVLLFMPRWLLLGPVGVLAVLSGLRGCPRHWVLQAATAAVVAGPLMGASAAVHQLWERPPLGERVRIATFNLGLRPILVGDLRRWIEAQKLDVICFQEGGTESDRLDPELPEGWHLSPKGHIATRLPVDAELPPLPHDWKPGRFYTAHMERVRLRTPSGRGFVVASVHLPTLREGIEGLLKTGGRAEMTRHTAWWGHEMARILAALATTSDVPLLIAGDFNMPADDSTMAALRSSFRFAFEEAGWGYGYTRPAQHPWVRIDHILTGPQWYVSSCRVGPDFGSDHLPVLAEVVLPGPPPSGKTDAR
jgi:vancomycin resistance protein VanJ